ncbi:MAG TPA: hypothetical protein VJW20_09755 [Candidatus Angelobacter sp.]|nr:hypothetical protein [Candidatus Angelobacter sp.]
MKDRVKQVYLMLGNILNNPRAFGLEERPPRPLQDAMNRMQRELMEALREETTEKDFLPAELSQDADCRAFGAVTFPSASFTFHDEDHAVEDASGREL